MIQYIIAAGIGAFIGSRSKKSKKSYAEGGEVDKIYYADLYRELRFEDMFKSNFPTKPKIRKLYNSRNTNSFGMKREYGIAIGEGRFILKFYYPIEEYRDDDFETAKKIINSFYNKGNWCVEFRRW